VTISTTNVTARHEKLPKTYALQQNFPNPLRSTTGMTVIPFQIPQQKEVVLEIYDLLGRRVRLLQQAAKPPGFYSAISISTAVWWRAASTSCPCKRDRLRPCKKLS
jgi:hypothetical protein